MKDLLLQADKLLADLKIQQQSFIDVAVAKYFATYPEINTIGFWAGPVWMDGDPDNHCVEHVFFTEEIAPTGGFLSKLPNKSSTIKQDEDSVFGSKEIIIVPYLTGHDTNEAVRTNNDAAMLVEILQKMSPSIINSFFHIYCRDGRKLTMRHYKD